jgi:hypothetical protein
VSQRRTIATRLRRQVFGATLGTLVILALIAGGYFAGRASISAASVSRPDSQITEESVRWTVRSESIGRTLKFVGTIQMPSVEGPLAGMEGIITQAPLESATVVELGAHVLSVDLRPVVAGQGSIPAFRDLEEGHTGADVKQLRDFFCASGYSSTCGKGDAFNAALTSTVKKWQSARGAAATGVVLRGDIMWFPTLPVTLQPLEDTRPGEPITPEVRPFTVLTGVPEITLDLAEEQAGLIPVGVTVKIGELNGVILGNEPIVSKDGEETRRRAILAAPDGVSPICQPDPQLCYVLLAGSAKSTVEMEVSVVPDVAGPVVPVRAIMSGAGGQTYVTDGDGRRVLVTIVASSSGLAVVEGVEVGDTIVLRQQSEDQSVDQEAKTQS